ncbi:MAG: hydroxyacid dehydrogenase [Bacteroidetes bacterium]|nr:hydroxyacid dehydrogenase [Bacteroidota bacterium]
MTKSILLIDTLHPQFIKTIEGAGISIREGYHLSKEEVLQEIHNYQGIAIRSRFAIDADFLEKAKTIKCIGRAGAGMENIDLIAAQKANIICVNAPEGNRTAVGEHALGMLLMLFNNLLRADKEVRQGFWRREENRGVELAGKTVGIIGFGQMGKSFAEKLRGFDVKILALDPYIKIDKNEFPYVEQCTEQVFFSECDVVSLHIPLTSETKYLVNVDWIQRFAKPIWFINTARGKNVDTQALVDGLKSGKIIGAALDVLEYETLSFEHIDKDNLPAPFQELCAMDQVVLSPHIAGWTHESNEKIARILAEKMIEVLI